MGLVLNWVTRREDSSDVINSGNGVSKIASCIECQQYDLSGIHAPVARLMNVDWYWQW